MIFRYAPRRSSETAEMESSAASACFVYRHLRYRQSCRSDDGEAQICLDVVGVTRE